MAAVTLASLIEGFFMEWLGRDRKASANTTATYRDAFRLFFSWLESERGVPPVEAELGDLTGANVNAFLVHLEESRGCAPSTLNNRLAAMQSFARYAARRNPERLGQYESIADVPRRKERRREVDYLTPEEVGWLLECCEPGSSSELMVAMLYNTGARISELVSLKADDVIISHGGRCRVRFLGKGRKERTVPLWEDTSKLLAGYIEANAIRGGRYVFPGRNVEHLTRSGARSRIDVIAARAAAAHPELRSKKVTPHVFRHSTAMAMLYAGVDIATVAIWLGHENVNTTHKYVVTNMEAKEAALSKIKPDWSLEGRVRYRASADVLAFLNSL